MPRYRKRSTRARSVAAAYIIRHISTYVRMGAPIRRPHTGSVQFIFWAELRYLSLPAFVPSTAIPRAAFDVNGTNRPLLRASASASMHLKTRIDAGPSVGPSRAQCSPTPPRSVLLFSHARAAGNSLFPSALSALLTPRDARFNEPRAITAT